jgi:hypothetical protein
LVKGCGKAAAEAAEAAKQETTNGSSSPNGTLKDGDDVKPVTNGH